MTPAAAPSSCFLCTDCGDAFSVPDENCVGLCDACIAERVKDEFASRVARRLWWSNLARVLWAGVLGTCVLVVVAVLVLRAAGVIRDAR